MERRRSLQLPSGILELTSCDPPRGATLLLTGPGKPWQRRQLFGQKGPGRSQSSSMLTVNGCAPTRRKLQVSLLLFHLGARRPSPCCQKNGTTPDEAARSRFETMMRRSYIHPGQAHDVKTTSPSSSPSPASVKRARDCAPNEKLPRNCFMTLKLSRILSNICADRRKTARPPTDVRT